MRTHITHLASSLRLAVIVGALASTSSFAQEQPAAQQQPVQSAPAPAPTPAPVAATTAAPVTPARGATMDDVRSKFGAPSQEIPAIGLPPITRWEYPGYVVFFEHDRVLHTVVVKS